MQAEKVTGLLDRERDFGSNGPMERTVWRPLSYLGRGTKANERGVERETEKEREGGSVSFELLVG